MNHTAGHGGLRQVVLGHQVDGGQVQGGLHHTGRLRAGTEAAEAGEEEEEIEHDLRQGWIVVWY